MINSYATVCTKLADDIAVEKWNDNFNNISTFPYCCKKNKNKDWYDVDPIAYQGVILIALSQNLTRQVCLFYDKCCHWGECNDGFYSQASRLGTRYQSDESLIISRIFSRPADHITVNTRRASFILGNLIHIFLFSVTFKLWNDIGCWNSFF